VRVVARNQEKLKEFASLGTLGQAGAIHQMLSEQYDAHIL
jgi:hypothetical protein